MSDDVFAVLGDERNDNRMCENRLVALLEHDKFDFIKRLLKNRWKGILWFEMQRMASIMILYFFISPMVFPVIYCIRYARAKNDAERTDLEEEMRGQPQLRSIVEQLTNRAPVVISTG